MVNAKFVIGERVVYNDQIYIINAIKWSESVASYVYTLGTYDSEIGGVDEANLTLVTRPTRSTLKPMDIVKLRDGRVCMVCFNRESEVGLSIFHLDAGGTNGVVIHVEKYNEDLTATCLAMYDIIAVYQPENGRKFIEANNYFHGCVPNDREWTWKNWETVKEIPLKRAEEMLKEKLKKEGELLDKVKIIVG